MIWLRTWNLRFSERINYFVICMCTFYHGSITENLIFHGNHHANVILSDLMPQAAYFRLNFIFYSSAVAQNVQLTCLYISISISHRTLRVHRKMQSGKRFVWISTYVYLRVAPWLVFKVKYKFKVDIKYFWENIEKKRLMHISWLALDVNWTKEMYM